MPDLAAAQRALRTTFGFEAFRPGQADIVAAILDGRDVLAVMPTGSGKSLCYQLPALLRDGLTVVVSPLIALMRNQVAQLRGYGVAAAALNSANDPDENRSVLDRIARGELRLVYVAPERLVKPDTLDLLKRAKVALLAVDEAHCISQWGHDFRPEYAALGTVQAELGGVQTVAFTATADAATRTDILAEAVPPAAGRVRARLRPAESAAGDAGKDRRPQADRGFHQGPSRAERHRLLRLAAQDRRTGRISARQTASRRCPITPAWRRQRARATRMFSCRRTASSWSRPSRSAWASTSRTCASCCTPTCRPTSKAITRRSAAPAATGCPPIR